MDQNLTTKLTNCTQVTIESPHPDYPILKISNASASAAIAVHGAHLIDFTPKGEKPIIFTSPSAIFKEGKAIRGGIPICWPYFNAHPSIPNAPAHGFARNRFWELLSVTEEKDSTMIQLSLPMNEEDYSKVGGSCELILELTISSSLTINLITTNTSEIDITIGGALHTYFYIHSISELSLSGLTGVNYLDTLTGLNHTNQSEIKISGEYDNVFMPSDHSVTLQDEGNSRKIAISKKNSNATTIWNPWIEKSKSMSDLGNEDYKKFICVEAINWKDDLRNLTPGESHSLIQEIKVI